jgi:hypothetical protein
MENICWLFTNALITGCLLVAAAAAAQAQSPAWTALDYSLAGGAATMMALDWAQTRYAARHPSHYSERNAAREEAIPERGARRNFRSCFQLPDRRQGGLLNSPGKPEASARPPM